MGDFEEDYDDDLYYEGDYMYVADSYDLADELAENAIPEPPYKDDILDEASYDDYDYYDYWMDIEYSTDEYYDVQIAAALSQGVPRVGQKRKSSAMPASGGPDKKRKVSSRGREILAVGSKGVQSIPTVLWLPFQETHIMSDASRPFRGAKPYALLPDWKQKFENADGPPTATTTEVENVAAPEQGVQDQHSGQEEEDDLEDDQEMQVDPTQLMTVLTSRLADSGLGEHQRKEFIESIMQMLSEGGGSNLDGMLEKLTGSLLEEVSEGGANTASAQWLSQQGISLPEKGEEEEEEREEDEAKEEAKGRQASAHVKMSSITANGRHEDISLRDSGISVVEGQSPTNGRDTLAPEDMTDPVEAKPIETDRSARSKLSESGRSSSSSKRDTALKAPRSTAPPSKKTSASSISRSSTITRREASAGSAAGTSGVPEVESKTALAQTRKRKAPADVVPGDDKQVKKRNYATPTASSQKKTAEVAKPTTRSTRSKK